MTDEQYLSGPKSMQNLYIIQLMSHLRRDGPASNWHLLRKVIDSDWGAPNQQEKDEIIEEYCTNSKNYEELAEKILYTFDLDELKLMVTTQAERADFLQGTGLPTMSSNRLSNENCCFSCKGCYKCWGKFVKFPCCFIRTILCVICILLLIFVPIGIHYGVDATELFSNAKKYAESYYQKFMDDPKQHETGLPPLHSQQFG